MGRLRGESKAFSAASKQVPNGTGRNDLLGIEVAPRFPVRRVGRAGRPQTRLRPHHDGATARPAD